MSNNTLSRTTSMATAPASIEVLLACDMINQRQGYEAAVGDNSQFCLVASGGEQASRQYPGSPDVVVIAASALSSFSGLINLVQFWSARSNVLLIMQLPNQLLVNEALATGALGVMTGSDGLDHFNQALGTVAQGEKSVSGTIGICLIGRDGGDCQLSDHQLRLLRLYALGYAAEEIAAELAFSKRTIATHFAQLKDQLGLYSRRQLVEQALRLRLIF